ncbi:hypothetical protein [Zobellella denitrificans]|jgi:hypothetical protein|uniref:Uncharacterized protein n=1 Tax=Zobellella denitrificans TaxID=347534 RepID=A0A291HU11_9GAMM|nr:hypothetical protein [Zobellella denitrificans]ATG75579.1 hypothetical protein AN401_18410 [Zobellella denitrificans]
MKKIVAGAMALLVVGCASESDNQGGEQYRYSPPVAKATNNTLEMAIPVDLVWARAEKWFREQGLNLESSQRGAGLMTASAAQSADGLAWLDCGTMGSKVALGNPNLQINMIITQSGNNSVATVSVKGDTALFFVEASGERIPAPSITPVCVSRGSLEQSLFASLGN